MPLLAAEAAKLSQEQMERGVIEEIIEKDELFALMPFMPINGKAYVYNREATLADGAFLDPNETVTEGAATFTQHTALLKILIGDVDLDKFLTSTQSDVNSQLSVQLAAKSKALGRQFRSGLVNGDEGANAKTFSGVRALTPAGQTLAAGANGAAITLAMIDELKDMVKLGADALMMRTGTWRAIRALLRAMGGNTGETIMVPNFGHPIKALDGTPIILNDYIPGNETQGSSNVTTSVYALRLNEADGFHGIVGNNMMGFGFEDIGTVQNKDANRYRVKWYAGTALKATHAIARLKGVTNL